MRSSSTAIATLIKEAGEQSATFKSLIEAIETSSILSGESRFDRFIMGDRRALSPDEQRGLQVLRGKGN